MEPGYIKGYAPGVRENGGQYSHAAVWAMIAFAALGDGDKAGELFAILNPINHASTRSGLYRYKVEPYVMAGDVYSESPHAGRGGWSWYTGSAGWMYRAGVEWILGFRLRGTTLGVDPCIPRTWPRFEIVFRYHSSRYRLQVENPRGAMRGVTRIYARWRTGHRRGDSPGRRRPRAPDRGRSGLRCALESAAEGSLGEGMRAVGRIPDPFGGPVCLFADGRVNFRSGGHYIRSWR